MSSDAPQQQQQQQQQPMQQPPMQQQQQQPQPPQQQGTPPLQMHPQQMMAPHQQQHQQQQYGSPYGAPAPHHPHQHHQQMQHQPMPYGAFPQQQQQQQPYSGYQQQQQQQPDAAPAPQQQQEDKSKMSWAQIARDPNAPEGAPSVDAATTAMGGLSVHNDDDQQQQQNGGAQPSGEDQQQVQQPPRVPTPRQMSWPERMTREAMFFNSAQRLYLWAMQAGVSPFAYLLNGLDPMTAQAIANGAPLAPGAPQQLVDLADSARHLRSVCSLPFLAYVNMDDGTGLLRNRRFLVVQCADEMEVFAALRRSAWAPRSDADADLVNSVFGEVAGVGTLVLLFVVRSLRKLVGLAEVMSPVAEAQQQQQQPQPPGTLPERFAHLRWVFVRDIPLHYLRQADSLSDPQQQQQQDDSKKKEEEAVESAEGGDSAAAAAAPAKESGEEKEQQQQQESEQDDKPEEQHQQPLRVYSVPQASGDYAYKQLARFDKNGGILIDFEEYARAEHEGRAPSREKLLCGGARDQRPFRGGFRGGSGNFRGSFRGRGGNYNDNRRGGGGGPRYGGQGQQQQGEGGATRPYNNRGRGSSSFRGGRGRGGFRQDRGGYAGRGGREGGDDRPPRDYSQQQGGGGRGGHSYGGSQQHQARRVEGSDGAQVLTTQYTFEPQQRRKGGGTKVGRKDKATAGDSEQAQAE